MVNLRFVADSAEKHDSFYLYDGAVIEERVCRLQRGFPGIHFLYSIKCNAHPEVLKSVFSKSFGADAASVSEVDMVKKCGLKQNDIYYSAPGKSNNDLKAAMDDSVIIADSLGEIERIQKFAAESERICRIGVRLNPAFTMQDDTGISSKFGIDEETFFTWADFCPELPNVEIIGLHVHLKSQILDGDLLGRYYDKMFALAKRFRSLPGIRLEFLNMGSGMGIPYSVNDYELDIDRLDEIVNRRVKAFCKDYGPVRVIIEVGRYVAGPAGCEPLFSGLDAFQFEVLKRSGPGHMDHDTDSGSAGLLGLTSGKDDHFFEQDHLEKVTLVGNLCTSADVMAEDILLPKLECGDLVIVKNAGSYAAVLSPMQFSSQEQPEEIFIGKTKK